jgi:hypothetical protein
MVVTWFRFRLFCDRRSVGQSVLVSGSHLGPVTRFVLLSDIFGLRVVGRPPWREDRSVIYLYNLLSLFRPSPTELMTTPYCLIWDSLNQEGQVPVFISLRNRVAQLYPWALGSPFVAYYDSQGYSELARVYLNARCWQAFKCSLLLWIQMSVS